MNATKGKVAVLNVWATWCEPCAREMPDIVKFYNDMDSDQVAFVSLSLDEVPEIDTAVREFQKKYSIPFPIRVLNERSDEGMLKAIRCEFDGMVPTTYIYNTQGELALQIMGAVPLAKLQQAVGAVRDGIDLPES